MPEASREIYLAQKGLRQARRYHNELLTDIYAEAKAEGDMEQANRVLKLFSNLKNDYEK